MSPVRPAGSDPFGVPDPPAAARMRRRSAPPGHLVPRAPHAGPLPGMRLTLRDGSRADRFGMPVQRPLASGPASSRAEAAEAVRHLRHVDSLVRDRWNRAGWDGRGGALTVVVNQRAMGGNAYFASHPDGRGELGIGVRDARIGFRRSPAHSPSILFHEYVHGIVATELQGLPERLGSTLRHREHHAVNESIADVLSTGLLDTGWRNGHEIRNGSPLRDLAQPSVPRWTKAVRTDGGLREHTLSGVLSRAAVVAAESAGTLPVVDAWYAGIDRHYRRELGAVRTPGSGRALGAWVRATMGGAADVGGPAGGLVDAVRSGWEAVGLGRYASEEHAAAMASRRRSRNRGATSK